jgi:Phospholipase_D-nuclease N-terminal
MPLSSFVTQAGSGLPSTRTVLALAPLFLLIAGLVLFCLVDIIRSPTVRYLPKAAWVLIVVCGSAPLGALAYLVWGRNRGDGHADGLDADDLAEIAAADRERSAGSRSG